MGDSLDKAELMKRIENDLEFLADALEVYKEDCPQLISRMHEALSREHSAALGDAVHTMKGLLSNFAAHPAVDAALRLEAMASRHELSGAEEALAVLENESNRVKAALEEMLRQG